MHRIAWLGPLALTDSADHESLAGSLALGFVLESARRDAIAMDELRILLCGLGHHDVHRMGDDAVLRAITEHVHAGTLRVVPATRSAASVRSVELGHVALELL